MTRFGVVSGDNAITIEQSQLLIMWQISFKAHRNPVLRNRRAGVYALDRAVRLTCRKDLRSERACSLQCFELHADTRVIAKPARGQNRAGKKLPGGRTAGL